LFFKKEKPPSSSSVEPISSTPLSILKQRIIKTDLPEYVSTQVTNELDKLEKIDSIVAEYAIGLNYIEQLLSLPWFSRTSDNLNLNRAEKILNERHYGLPLVKERVLEFLAAKTLKSQEKARMLIVDDEKIARNNLHYYFTDKGFTVETAENGRDAIEKVQKSLPFDILITDLKMDEVDGLELIEQVGEISPATNIIMVTGYATVSTAVDALRKGATHYLSKPVELDELRKTVEEILQKNPKCEFNRGPVLCFNGPPGTGKTSIGQAIAAALGRKFVRLSMGGLRDEAEIWVRIWSCATRKFNKNTSWASVGDIKQPESHKKAAIAENIQNACGALQERGGEILVEAPWGADVCAVINNLRSMKAKHPEMRAAVVDHFHCLARHRNAPSGEASMLEERAYKLMTAAKELGIDLIVLAQMNRVGMNEERLQGGKRPAPSMDQIRGTDALSHVSHAVWIVRKKAANEDDPNASRDLEFWHAKTRGRQAVWREGGMSGVANFVDCSDLVMDYSHCSIQRDDTISKV